MNESGEKDHWGALASHLGVQDRSEEAEAAPAEQSGLPSPAEIQPAEVVSEATTVVSQPARSTVWVKPERSSNAWDRLADNLGIQRPEPVISIPPAETVQSTDVVSPAPPAAESGWVTTEEKKEEVEPEWAESNLPVEEPPSPRPLEEERPDDQRSGRRRRKRRRRSRRSPPEATGGATSESEAEELETVGDDIDLEDRAEPSLAQEESSEDEGRRPRREGEKGRREQEPPRSKPMPSFSGFGAGILEPAAEEVAAEATSDLGRSAQSPPAEVDEAAAQEAALAEDDLEEAKQAIDEGEEGEEPRSGGGKDLHRAIPNWEQAVHFIIAKNMESRAKKPNGDRPRSHERRNRGNRSRPSERSS